VAVRRLVPPMGPGRHRRARAVGAAAAAVLAGIHLDRVGHAAREAGYLGVLFAVAAACFGWVAARLFSADDVDSWLAAAALALGVGAGYLLSCTVGLPGISPEQWSVLGDTSTAAAALLLVATVARSKSEERLSDS
jgi:peptidoglycan/LPS O-acetylase OafA/YrhL